MKKIIAISLCLCLFWTLSWAQRKNLQLSFNINPLDAVLAAEFGLSEKSTLYTGIGFGYGTVSAPDLNFYYDKSRRNGRNSDIGLPKIFFAPYLNVQYRNYFSKIKNKKEGYYTDNNSGMYFAARFKLFTSPLIPSKGDTKPIKENYMLGLMMGYQKVFGVKKRFMFNSNGGFSAHANYNLSFYVYKPMLYSSIGYIIK